MNISKLHFFDKLGYELNFDWNENRKCWEGNIYLPKVSVGLYANTTIYVLEEAEINGRNQYIFPTKDDTHSEFVFSWDILNNFVDEFFMFTFDSSLIMKDTSSLIYTENDGPECEPVLITRFDEYHVKLYDSATEEDDIDEDEIKYRRFRALPIHVAFTSPEKFNGNTFKRTLVMECNNKEVARISFFAEAVEEDERLKIWNNNLGYNILPEDEMIFRKSDIKESYPDYQLLNEKRKELMINGHEIYPHIGSYKALINAIKFFGYDNLNIIEFWRNVNELDSDFGKIYRVKKYELTENEVIVLKDKKITLPSINYKKSSNIGLSYLINRPIMEFNEYELPSVEETDHFTIEEMFIKLFALRDKLNKEFLPGRSRIVDITGEASFFGLCGIKSNPQFASISLYESGVDMSIDAFPSNTIRITNNKLLNEYIFNNYIDNWNNSGLELDSDSESDTSESDSSESESDTTTPHSTKPKDDDVNDGSDSENDSDYDSDSDSDSDYYNNTLDQNTILSNINDLTIGEISSSYAIKKSIISKYIKSNNNMCDVYKNFYNELNVAHSIVENIVDDLYDYDSDYYVNEQSSNISAKVILTNTSFQPKTFNDIDNSFDNYSKFIRFNNIDYKDTGYHSIEWTLRFSEDQIDEDRKKIGIIKEYPHKEFVSETKSGLISEYGSVFFELPYVGYYDVNVKLIDDKNNTCSKIFKKYIKVEPYDIDIRGFYYDARELPDTIEFKDYYNAFINGEDSDSSDNYDEIYLYYKDMYEFITQRMRFMTEMAVSESTTTNNIDMSMPVYRTMFRTLKVDENTEYVKFYTDETTYRIYKEASVGFRYMALSDIDTMESTLNKIQNSYWKSSRYMYGYPIPLKDDEGNNIVSILNDGPYTMGNMFEEWYLMDNVNSIISKLVPEIKYARYIHNGVDVKPYTWILLGFENSLITGKRNPHWRIENKRTGEGADHFGKFLTYLLKEEGDYVVTLELEDVKGNVYRIERIIAVVSKNANYKIYTPFKNDYDEYLKTLYIDYQNIPDVENNMF